MKLTPLDLAQKTFRRVRLGGVDEREVAQFLEQAAAEMEDLLRRVHAQDEELRRREQRIEEFRDRESLLQSTLTTAQRLADEMKVNARKEGEILLSDAELQAEKIIATAQARRIQLLQEIEELRRSKAAFVQQLSAILESHRSLLDQVRDAESQSRPPPVPGNVAYLPPGKRAEPK